MTATAATPSRVLVLCPSTGAPVSTVLKLREPALQALRGEYAFRCEKCGEIHRWSKDDAWLEAERQR